MRWIACLIILVLALAAAAGALAGGAAAPSGDVVKGELLYAQKCAVCHGATGKGDGPAEFVLFPRPRDLTSGRFKIRSTTTLPTDEDLFRVITSGIPGTAMPSWAALPEGSRWDLVAYVKSLSPVFEQRAAGPPLKIPPSPQPTPALLALGERFYAEAGCVECHGPTGRGDGTSAPTLTDDWGNPIVPYDFTIPGRMKAGSTARDVYRTLLNGIGGTPMPSYADSLSGEEMWGLAYYVLSLAKAPPRQAPAETGTVRVRRVAGELPADPGAAVWQRAPRQAVPLRTLWLRPKTIDRVRVAALHNGREIGFLLEWDDPIQDQTALGVAEFRDAAAIQFPVRPPDATRPEPNYVMGDREAPVNIWHWKADWQLDLARYRGVEDRYPAAAVDDGSAMRNDLLFLTARAAGNPMALPRRSAVENLNAAGLGTLTSQPPEAQVVKGQGRWADGRWQVVIVRALRTGNPRDAQFEPGLTTRVAFAVWDGAQRDRDGQKAVSVWQRLLIEAGR